MVIGNKLHTFCVSFHLDSQVHILLNDQAIYLIVNGCREDEDANIVTGVGENIVYLLL